MVTRVPDRVTNFMVVALMHNDEHCIAFIRNVLKNHELLTVRMYPVAGTPWIVDRTSPPPPWIGADRGSDPAKNTHTPPGTLGANSKITESTQNHRKIPFWPPHESMLTTPYHF